MLIVHTNYNQDKQMLKLAKDYAEDHDLDFSKTFVVVNSNNIDVILYIKKKISGETQSVPVMGTYDECSHYMSNRFQKRGSANIVMRIVNYLYDDHIFLGNIVSRTKTKENK